MASFNKVILLGNLTRDPQLSYLPSQTAVVEFGLAINRRFKKQDGSQGEEVCYVDCTMFGARAEVINKYLKKGNPVFVEGRLRFESWQGQDGQKRSRLRVQVENFEFIGAGGSGGGGSQRSGSGGGDYAPPSQMSPNNDIGAPGFGSPDDDIPF